MQWLGFPLNSNLIVPPDAICYHRYQGVKGSKIFGALEELNWAILLPYASGKTIPLDIAPEMENKPYLRI